MTTVTTDPTSAPDLSEYADQQQSPLCRLPRELRDQIYEYYSYDEEGLEYDYAYKTLKYASGKELDLPRTCKMVANEMKGIHLQVNTITFTPCCLEREEDSFRGLRSLSARFEHLLHLVQWTKLLMLHYAVECVTDDMIAQVVEACPGMSGVFWAIIYSLRDRPHPRIWGMLWTERLPRDEFTASFCEAVQLCLNLISSDPRFDDLVSQVFVPLDPHPDRYHRRYSPHFVEGSLQQILAWQPDPWLIPTVEELSRMEQLLTPQSQEGEDWTRQHFHIKLCFSATAICAATLRRLPTNVRKHVRSIILRENCRAVSYPDAHAEGLIPFCKENLRLRILSMAGLTTNLAPSFWEAYGPGEDTYVWNLGAKYLYIRILVDWLTRTADLHRRGMPNESFTATLDVRSQEAFRLWRYVERAAAVAQHLVERLGPQHELISKFIDSHGKRSYVLMQKFAKTWRLPLHLSTVFNDVMNGRSMIRLDLPTDELLKPFTPTEPFSQWTSDDFVSCYYVYENQNFPGDEELYLRTFLGDSSDRTS